MLFLARKVDRDDNNVIEDNEARFVGRVGNNNGVNGTSETARALNSGEAMLYGFQLARDWAEAIAKKLAGNDPWVSREDLDISEDARRRLDTNRDNRISADELADGLQRGGLGINAKELVTTDEAKAKFSRPTPPRPDTDRPRPPRPDVDRPTPPRPDVDRPAPPPVYNHRTPTEVLSRFQRAQAELKQVYNSTSMSRADYEAAERRLLEQATREMKDDTRSHPYSARKAALEGMYSSSSMSQAQKQAIEKELVRDALADIKAQYATWPTAKAALEALYSNSSMSQAEKQAAERELMQKEIERIVFGSFPSFSARQMALEALYSNSSMSQSERSEISRRIEAEEVRRVTRY